MAGVAGFEPTLTVLETAVLPLDDTPKKNGVPEEIRTPDTRLRRPLLYPTELLARIIYYIKTCYVAYIFNVSG